MLKWIKAQWAQLQRAREILRAIDRLQKFMKTCKSVTVESMPGLRIDTWHATNGLVIVRSRLIRGDLIEFKSHCWILLEYAYNVLGAQDIKYEKHFSHKDVQDFIDHYKE